MRVIALPLLFAARVLSASTETSPPADPHAVYAACQEAVGVSNEAGIEKCEIAAQAGIPGAQYALGVMLVHRNSGDDRERGTEWLEKAAAAGHPPAANELVSVLMSRPPRPVARARKLHEMAICAGYPQALTTLEAGGRTRADIDCPPATDTDFSGEWSISLKWDEAPAAESIESYRVAIDGNTARVTVLADGKWSEVKAGEFTVTQEGESLTVAAMNSGWDYDGKWIESWTIQLMRRSAGEAAVAFMRTVNNPHLPARFNWKTFANFAEGTARRLER